MPEPTDALHSVTIFLRGYPNSLRLMFRKVEVAALAHDALHDAMTAYAKNVEGLDDPVTVRDDFGNVLTALPADLVAVLRTDILADLAGGSELALLNAKAQTAVQRKMGAHGAGGLFPSPFGGIHQ